MEPKKSQSIKKKRTTNHPINKLIKQTIDQSNNRSEAGSWLECLRGSLCGSGQRLSTCLTSNGEMSWKNFEKFIKENMVHNIGKDHERLTFLGSGLDDALKVSWFGRKTVFHWWAFAKDCGQFGQRVWNGNCLNGLKSHKLRLLGWIFGRLVSRHLAYVPAFLP